MIKKNEYIIPKVALLSVMSAILSFIKVPVFFIPSFYKLEFSESIVLLGSLYLGPCSGVLILLFKNILLLFLKGSQSLGVGEFANFILGIFFIIPPSIIYRSSKALKALLIGMILGVLLEGFASVFLNFCIFLPFYSSFLFMPINDIIKAGHKVNPLIYDLYTFVIFTILPFNLFKFSCICVLNVIVYKKLSYFVDKFFVKIY